MSFYVPPLYPGHCGSSSEETCTPNRRPFKSTKLDFSNDPTLQNHYVAVQSANPLGVVGIVPTGSGLPPPPSTIPLTSQLLGGQYTTHEGVKMTADTLFATLLVPSPAYSSLGPLTGQLAFVLPTGTFAADQLANGPTGTFTVFYV
jgi:hypothetical protein